MPNTPARSAENYFAAQATTDLQSPEHAPPHDFMESEPGKSPRESVDEALRASMEQFDALYRELAK